MNFLFYLGHPAHFHLFKNAIRILKSMGHHTTILIKKKDVLEDLVKSTGWEYININPRGRKDNLFSIGLHVLRRDFVLMQLCRRLRPQKMFGTAVEITHVGRLMGIPSIVLNEDDSRVIPLFARLAFPFADVILCPGCVDIGKWENKKTGYKGFHELAYLHPKYFTPDQAVGQQLKKGHDRYFILRFSKLGAHHDFGFRGIADTLAADLVKTLEAHGPVYISSERVLPAPLESRLIPVSPSEMHSALYYADLYIGDSQTMAAEAAVVGTPSIRFSDFAGRLSYLKELEDEYGLAYSFDTHAPDAMKQKISELLAVPGLKSEWARKRDRLLEHAEDLTQIIVKTALETKTLIC